MRHVKEESGCGTDQTIDLKSAIEELNGLASRELNKLLKDSENFTIQLQPDNGTPSQVDMERLASSLPLHLIAVLLSDRNCVRLAHLLRGFRLLHSLSDLASRHARLEQILLDEVKVSEQILDLIFYTLIVLGCYEQDNCRGTSVAVLHAVLVACALHLLTGYISSQWQDLVHVLLAHPKVDIFMDVAFDAVHVDIRFLHIMVPALKNDVLCNKSSLPAAEGTVQYFCQQCEASLQFLLFLCQQKLFRDRLLKNKELCRNGGILSLAFSILKLNLPECFKESVDIVAAISRLKAKILSILLQLCEAESISYLDEVAGSLKSMCLAKSVALEMLDLLKTAFRRGGKQLGSFHNRSNPKGVVLLNAMRLADIFSDDSNFRSFFMANAIPVLVEILAIPHDEFLSNWCSINVPVVEEDANVEYDPFMAAGVALDSVSNGCENLLSVSALLNEANSMCPNTTNGMPSVTYAQHRTSYLVKIIANLHCFVPNICEEEERNLFLNKFYQCLLEATPESFSTYPLSSGAQKAVAVCENLGSLSDYATSLIPNLLNDEDVQLLSVFSKQLLELFPPQFGNNLNKGFCVKEEGTADSKPGEPYSWNAYPNSNYCKNHQDAQSTVGDVPPSRKADGSALDEGLNFKDDAVSIKQEAPESSFLQEVNQVNVASKPRDISDEFELENDGGKKITAWDASGSLRCMDRDMQNVETNNMDVEAIKGDPDLISDTGEFFKIEEFVKESTLQDDERAETIQGEEKQPRKRKRNIMNEMQIVLIEKALLEEPEMQRNAALLQSWADKLSVHGSELTPSQLKNWLNNRKARLARAARDFRAPPEGENAYTEKSVGSSASHFYDSSESAGEECYLPLRGSNNQCIVRSGGTMQGVGSEEMAPLTDFTDFAPQRNIGMSHHPARSTLFEPGDLVSLVDNEGRDVGKGKVFQVGGRWHGKCLEAAGTCIVDITELKIEKCRGVQHPSEAAGLTFEEAAARNGGIVRVAWDANRIAKIHK